MDYVAHIRKADFKIQTVQEHLEAVSNLAERFGVKAGFASMAELAGFLHDMGKNSKAFRTYIERAVKQTGEPLERIDHSTAGAKYLYEKYYIHRPLQKLKPNEVYGNFVVEIVGMVILSHHSGLQNFVQLDGSESDYFRRVCNKDLPYYEEVRTEFLNVPGNKEKVDLLFEQSIVELQRFFGRLRQIMDTYEEAKPFPQFIYYSLLMKYIFSCLIDADRTDARRFEEGDRSELFLSYHSFFKKSYEKLMNQLDEWVSKPEANTPINRLRREMSDQCANMAEKPSSIYQLSVPTGGGKTLASLRYALKHAQKFNKDRIIYVVPFTTILEQNAEVVREIIQEDLVLEHHANVIDETMEDTEFDYYGRPMMKTIQLARDNWDYPIIFTTLVQFMDAFYAKGTRKGRRMHNLTNAVIIFDEVQSVPVKHIPLFNTALNFLHHIGNSSIILCTATQPSLTKTKYPLLMFNPSEIVQQLPEIAKAFKRVEVINKVTHEAWTAEQISEFAEELLYENQSILVILNTKKAVLNVYQHLNKLELPASVYHLSTSMCPAHRKDILEEVKEKIDNPNERVICVSTQLIEAGVDISFKCVIRSLTGLDSLAQAAGRCNRHGEDDMGKVFLIRAKDESLSRLPEISLGQKVLEEDVLSKVHLINDLLGPTAIQTYFDHFMWKAEREVPMTDSKLNLELIQLIDRNDRFVKAIPDSRPIPFMRAMFKTLENHFEVIEAKTTAVLVPYNDRAREVIAALNEEINDYTMLNQLLKEAQLYSVNVYHHTIHQLITEDLMYPLFTEGIYAIHDIGYHNKYGLSIEGLGEQNIPLF